MELKKLSEHIWYMPFEEERDRPNLGYVRGDKRSLAIDAGHSEAHIREFYSLLQKEGLPLPSLTVLTHWHWDHRTLFLLPAAQIARNTVIATPVENIDLYYIDPSDSEFARLGLEYTTQGETNLIGFHAQGNYSTAVGESYALMGMALWAEYLDGIAVVYIGTETKVTNAETITADASDTHLFKTAHSPLLSVQDLKDGSTAITNYTIERDGVRLASTPSGTVTIKYTYVA